MPRGRPPTNLLRPTYRRTQVLLPTKLFDEVQSLVAEDPMSTGSEREVLSLALGFYKYLLMRRGKRITITMLNAAMMEAEPVPKNVCG